MELLLALVAAAAGLVGAWLGAWLGSRGTHDQWLRGERLRAYSELYAACQAYEDDSSVDAINLAAGAVQLLGPSSVQALLGNYVMATFRKRNSGLSGGKAFAEMLRAEREFMTEASAVLGAVPANQNHFLARHVEDPEPDGT